MADHRIQFNAWLRWVLPFSMALAGCAQAPQESRQADSRTETQTDFSSAAPSIHTESSAPASSQPPAESPAQQEPEISAQSESVPATENGLTVVDGILLVNKKHGVPADYAPGVDPEAQHKCSELIAGMIEEGLDVSWTTSNYRSYEYQSQLYDNYVASHGQAQADTFSARPGFSEHQTGLAFDLMNSAGELLTSPAEAQWLLDHAAEYGFIVRYQKGSEAVTGYQAEPWHLRYIGERAQEIAQSGLTLEEYLNMPGGDYE